MPGHAELTQHTKGPVHWPGILDRYDVRFLVLDIQKDGDLLQLFWSHPEWAVDTEDGDAVLLIHSRTAQKDHDQAGPHSSVRFADQFCAF
jgi:hypothetical protein